MKSLTAKTKKMSRKGEKCKKNKPNRVCPVASNVHHSSHNMFPWKHDNLRLVMANRFLSWLTTAEVTSSEWDARVVDQRQSIRILPNRQDHCHPLPLVISFLAVCLSLSLCFPLIVLIFLSLLASLLLLSLFSTFLSVSPFVPQLPSVSVSLCLSLALSAPCTEHNKPHVPTYPHKDFIRLRWVWLFQAYIGFHVYSMCAGAGAPPGLKLCYSDKRQETR